jgi:hypothetical protein
MKKLFMLLLVLSLLVASPVLGGHALPTSGDYLKYCQESIKVYEDKHADKLAAAECLGFVEGAIGMHAALNAFGQSTPFYCMPEHGVDSFDATTTWVKYLEKNPQKLDKQPVLSFLLAMKEAFRCPQN